LKVIGIFGGTFAPIHHGHLRLAIEARDALQLDEVRLIPAAQPPLRAAPALPAARRLRWVRLAIGRERGLVADGRELARRGPSYTIDTLVSLRAQFPRAALCLLLGQDAARSLPRWHRWRELLEYAHLVIFARPGQQFLRMSASAEAAAALQRMNLEIDVRHVLPMVQAPTLLIHAKDDRGVPVGASRQMAEVIPNATVIELDSPVHLPFYDKADEIIGHIQTFLTGGTAPNPVRKPGRDIDVHRYCGIDRDGGCQGRSPLRRSSGGASCGGARRTRTLSRRGSEHRRRRIFGRL
jgi:nicotinate-nucleotide adenylyltransferase